MRTSHVRYASSMKRCTKCAGNVCKLGDNYQCIQCGKPYYVPIKYKRIRPSIDGLRTSLMVLPYVGKFNIKRNQNIRVEIGTKSVGTPAYMPECPYCTEKMYHLGDTKYKKHEVKPLKFHFFKCSQGHKLRLLETQAEGFTGWQ